MERKRCSRCYHELPLGKTTWRPRWAWWPGGVIGVESNNNHQTFTYASDGPSLGAIGKIIGKVNKYKSYVLDHVPQYGMQWPNMKCIGYFQYQHDAKHAVEIWVKANKLWP